MAGSLLLAWQVKNKRCLVIGGGDVALSRVHHMIKAEASITVVTGTGNVHPEIIELHSKGLIYQLLERDFRTEDLSMYEKPSNLNPQLVKVSEILSASQFEEIRQAVQDQVFAVVCCCIDDYDLSTQIYYQCKFLRLPVNIADKPPMCDFYFGSMYNQDNLQIMISTNGMSPRLSKLIKDNIARQFDGIDLNRAIENLGLLRARLRALVITKDDLTSIDERMQWIKSVTDYFSIRQWSELELSEGNADAIVRLYPSFPPREYDWWVKR
ncbi:siroheme biosynthesis protein Met8p [[Candida] railenensis]|uniref:precorrin-2 dehydrogenase n=1 Tax=[Candida] railenensis TaxID=45579 RepID=A0A9P0QSR0_9ASCO|nr:siroheme biosynthesis protein Met8p [[Candida] railenensis]